VLSSKVILVANTVPLTWLSYHLIPEPVAVKSATVWGFPEQKDCVAGPVGATGEAVMVAVTFSLAVLSQPTVVWLA
jgi:hypothetical protein